MHVHFIAIGGSVMHQLALSLKSKGYTVSGSDDAIRDPARSNLEAAGILPAAEGWFPEKITSSLDSVILGMHARDDNPELQKARALGIPVYSFPEYIYHESRNKQRIIVGGSHGKTTTTAMIMHVLKESGFRFDYLVGARLTGFDRSVQLSEDAPLLVCEGDEYPASVLEKRPKFHFLYPHIAILTGISWDHINVFPTIENYLEQFSIFIQKIEPGGKLIYNAEDDQLKDLIAQSPRADIEYIPYRIPEHLVNEGKTTVTFEGNTTALQVFGDHNLLNMHAAFLACRAIGLAAADFTRAIGHFTGASRRLELIGHNHSTSVYRDFAHAPSKLRATLAAVKAQFPRRRLLAIFELHTFSSLNQNFLSEYAGTMDPADEAVVYFSSHALELKRLPPLNSEMILEGFANSNIKVINSKTALEDWLSSRNYHEACLLFMSSGDFDGLDSVTFARRLTASPVDKG